MVGNYCGFFRKKDGSLVATTGEPLFLILLC